MPVLNTLTIFGNSYFVSPNEYNFYYEGETSRMIPSSNGTILDISYARPCFNATLYLSDASAVLAFQEQARNAIANNTPIQIQDTVYPGGRTWSGYFKLPIVSKGSMPYKSNDILTEPIQVTFHNIELELA